MPNQLKFPLEVRTNTHSTMDGGAPITMRLLLVSSILVSCWIHVAISIEDLIREDAIPPVRRVEGRVTLEYVDGNKRLKKQLAFTEVADATTRRSKISIGQVSYEPQVYYTRGKTVMTLDSLNKKCRKLPESIKLLPELNDFINYSYTAEDIDTGLSWLKAECHSPTAIFFMNVRMFIKYTPSLHRTEMHRNVICSVYRSTYSRSKSHFPIHFDIFMPAKPTSKDSKMPFIAVREIVEGVGQSQDSDKVITIDFFYVEKIDKTNRYQLEKLEEELSLPFGKGCSEFVRPVKPKIPDSQSFMMNYIQSSTGALVSLAYDHEFGYLRRELEGQSVSIWDLNEDLLYHHERRMKEELYKSNTEDQAPECSVLKFDDSSSLATQLPAETNQDSNISPLFRPYDKKGMSLDVLKFIGADTIYYMGRSIVRDLPCLVFETISSTPPKIFMSSRIYGNEHMYSYIVQYYLFIDDKKDTAFIDNVIGETSSDGMPINLDRFWPAKIDLYLRHNDNAWIHLHESLDVLNFHWGLYGWQKKPSELFMMPECFDDEEEQLKIELALQFKQITPIDRQKIIARYKYKLELDLQANLFKLFQISRLHLTEYTLTMLKHNMIANLVLSDRKEDKKLSFFGEGNLPSVEYRNNIITLTARMATRDLEKCVMAASHIKAVSMVIYCPATSDDRSAECTAIHGEIEQVIKRREGGMNNTTTIPACQVYRFEPSEPPKSATHDIVKFKQLLDNYKFTLNFKEDSSGQFDKASMTGEAPIDSVEVIVEDYDVTREQQLITISNYRFAILDTDGAATSGDAKESDDEEKKPANVRYFPTISYDTLSDCSRMCDLDSSCKSFSYCYDTTMTGGRQCVLSSLDIRKNNIESQMVHEVLDSNNQITVKTIQELDKQVKQIISATQITYKLELRSGCEIHERDFLSSFTRTDEFLHIQLKLATQFATAPSATECARRVVEHEEMEETYHGAAFAYCAHTGTCLNDDNMFTQVEAVGSNSVAEEDDVTPGQGELLSCQMFRKRYQTYFHVSSMVVKRPPAETAKSQTDSTQLSSSPILSGGIKQIVLSLNTVEECARTCWVSFGNVCISFDYCSPNECIINAVANSDDVTKTARQYDPASIEYEIRKGCLAYKRSLKWDHLRRNHFLGKHKLLDAEETKPDNRSHGGWFLNIMFACAILVLFDVGLIIGKKLTYRRENTRGSGQSIRSDSTQNLTRILRSNFRSNMRSDERMSSVSRFNIERETYDHPDAFRMDEFNSSNGAGPNNNTHGQIDEAGEEDMAAVGVPDETQKEHVATTSMASAKGYIDVPQLI